MSCSKTLALRTCALYTGFLPIPEYKRIICVCLQAGRTEAEQALQQTLEKVKAELCQAQSNSSTLQGQLQQAQQAQQDGTQLSGQ